MENQVVNNVFVNKVVYKLYLWKNIMKMVINLLMCYYKRLHYSCYNVYEIHKLIYTIENYCKTYKKYTITPIKTFRFIIILGNKMFSAFTVTE